MHSLTAIYTGQYRPAKLPLSAFESTQDDGIRTCQWVLRDVSPYSSVSQPPGRGSVPGPGINYTGPREVLLEFVILVFQAFFMNK